MADPVERMRGAIRAVEDERRRQDVALRHVLGELRGADPILDALEQTLLDAIAGRSGVHPADPRARAMTAERERVARAWRVLG